MSEHYEINEAFEQVVKFVTETNQSVFLTGKAGTGKTTLLKHIQKNCIKQLAIIAPTGVAAINAGGTTIHSMFQFPFTPFIPGTNKQLLESLKYNSQRLGIFRHLELLIIDEVSMVRADLMDAIDVTLRSVRRKHHLPFGGVQLLLIGDMYQLPPVVQNEEWNLLSAYYPSPYFFDSQVIRQFPPIYIELQKIYRQNEQTFINVLNQVRNNQINRQSMEVLNSRFVPEISRDIQQDYITLTTHNHKADEMNRRAMEHLTSKAYHFKADVQGIFNEKNYPNDEELILKEGAKVMFLKNDPEKSYFNGKTGTIIRLNQDEIIVKCPGDHYEIKVKTESWRNVSYHLNKNNQTIEEEVLGTYTQYPLRLAWAITIHKSQGLTFDKVIIDAGDAFSSGQVYVALSRCRSLEGLILKSRIPESALFNDQKVVAYSNSKPDENTIKNSFQEAKKKYFQELLLTVFDLTEMAYLKKDLAGSMTIHQKFFPNSAIEWLQKFSLPVDELYDTSEKFKNQLRSIWQQVTDPETDHTLQTRIKQASDYFEKKIFDLYLHIKNIPFVTESKSAEQDINPLLNQLHDALFIKQHIISACREGFNVNIYTKARLSIKMPSAKLNIYATSKKVSAPASVKHPRLYHQLILLRDEICDENNKPIYMVANNNTIIELCERLPSTPSELEQISGFGKAKVKTFGSQFLEIINAYRDEFGLEGNLFSKPTSGKKSGKKEKTSAPKIDTKEASYILFKEGKSISEIATLRSMTPGTIESHLLPYIAKREINIFDLVDPDHIQQIEQAIEEIGHQKGLSILKSALPEEISFNEIKMVLAHLQGE